MKPNLRFPLLLAALLLLILAGCVPVSFGNGGVVIGEAYRLGAGQTLNNDLTVVGGNVTLEQNSTVNGDVAVMGANVTVDGTVNGNISAVGGNVTLDDHAVVKGQVEALGGNVNRSNKAVVENQDTGRPRIIGPITAVRSPMRMNFDPITGPLMAIFQAFALAALAVLASLFLIVPLDRTGRTALVQPAASAGIGCLTILVLVIMAITIILLPFSLLGGLIVGVAALFGWLALGLVVGRQISIWLKQPWTDPVSAGLGTLVISLLASILGVIPCIGWTIPAIAGFIALGAVVLTRFGTQQYPAPFSGSPVPRPGPYIPPAPRAPETPSYPREEYQTGVQASDAPDRGSEERPAGEEPPA